MSLISTNTNPEKTESMINCQIDSGLTLKKRLINGDLTIKNWRIKGTKNTNANSFDLRR